MRKILTLCIIQKDTKVLLGMKKKGFGEGKWNGFGGKVQQDESIEEGAIREVREEALITPTNLEKRGVLEFRVQNEDEILEVHIFYTNTYTGTPAETNEMKPEWFEIQKIPYTEMWPDDFYWLPKLLQGKYFTGTFLFDESTKILEHSLNFVSKEEI